MARSQSNDSASSQFFIMHEDAPSLDGEYAAFGCAYSGMEIVDKICNDVKTEDSNGTVLKESASYRKYYMYKGSVNFTESFLVL